MVHAGDLGQAHAELAAYAASGHFKRCGARERSAVDALLELTGGSSAGVVHSYPVKIK